MTEVIGVKFNKAGKIYYFDPKGQKFSTDDGVVVEAFLNSDGTTIESLRDRIVGRYTNKKVIHPETKEVIVDRNTYITENLADKIIAAGIEKVSIRTVLTCKCKTGVCKHIPACGGVLYEVRVFFGQ